VEKQYLHLLLLAVLSCPAVTLGQSGSFDRPSESRPELPSFQAPAEGEILPPVVLPKSDNMSGITAGRTVFIEGYRFTGNRVFSESALQEIAAPFSGRQVSYGDIEKLRTLITEAYIRAGYVNSGALIPDQKVRDRVIEIRIVEGVLSEVTAKSDGRYRVAPARQQLERLGTPLNVYKLEEQLQLLQQDPRIARLDAQLTPGERPGTAHLNVDIDEARPWSVSMVASNEEPAPIGESALRLGFRHLNLFGLNDELFVSGTVTEGLNQGEVSYTVPVNSYGTVVSVRGFKSESEVVQAPFDDLAIESESRTLSLELSHPLWRTLNSRMNLFLRADSRRSFTSLLGEGFSFTPGPDRGLARVNALRLGQDYIRRSANQVFALRTTVSAGLDVGKATINDDNIPDGEFVAVLLQTQLARRFEWLNSQLIARFDLQWSDSPLLGMEQFAVGGLRTVRGYVENTLVTDNGLVGSLEWRVPLWRSGDNGFELDLAPFVDAGKAWNTDRADPDPDTLTSVGLGLLVRVKQRYRLDIWYGEALEDDIADPIGSSLQEDGINASFSVTWP